MPSAAAKLVSGSVAPNFSVLVARLTAPLLMSADARDVPRPPATARPPAARPAPASAASRLEERRLAACKRVIRQQAAFPLPLLVEPADHLRHSVLVNLQLALARSATAAVDTGGALAGARAFHRELRTALPADL